MRSLNSSGDRQATATAVANFLGKAKKRPFGISPEAEQDVRDIHQSLLNRSVADNKMGASGSNTAADIQNHIGRQLARHGSYMVAGGLAGLPFGGPIGSVVGGLAGLAGGAGVEWANRRVAREVAERAADSSMAMNALGRVLGANNRRAAVNQKMIPFFNNLGTMNPAFIRAYMATQGDSTQPDYAH